MSNESSHPPVRALVVDANILIAYLDADDATHERSLHILTANAHATFMASAINVAEALVYPAQGGLLTQAQDVLSLLDLNVLAVSERDVAALALLRAETGAKMPYLCALLAARNVGGHLATFDQRLASAARQHGIEVIEA